MTIPHITIEQFNAMKNSWHEQSELDYVNSRIDAYNKANVEQEQLLISAEEARKLGAGNAEILEQDGKWRVCGIKCQYPSSHFFGEHKYRAIKQPESVEPHAELKSTVKLTIDDELPKMLTLAQCEAERLARIHTHIFYIDWHVTYSPP